MFKLPVLRSLLCLFLVLTIAPSVSAGPDDDGVDLRISPAMREYCHVIRFSQGWRFVQREPVLIGWGTYNYYDHYEFRVEGLLSTTFLVGGYKLKGDTKEYTLNKYQVNFSDFKSPVLPATDVAWDAATPLGTSSPRFDGILPSRKPSPVKLNGLEFMESGDIGAGALLSRDRAWLAVQSWTGRAGASDEIIGFSCFPFGCRGKLYFDIFSVATSKKAVTIQASYTGPDPFSLIKGEWVTERYFIIPLGKHRDRCLICEFGRGNGSKP